MRTPRPILGATALAAVLTLAGCASGGSGSSHGPDRGAGASTAPATRPGEDRRPAIASVLSTPAGNDPQVKVDLVGLNRLGSAHVVVQLRVTNPAAQDIDLGPRLQETNDGGPAGPDGIALVDPAARRLLGPYRQAGGGGCLCSPKRDDSGWYARAGGSLSLFAVLPAPSGGAATTTVYTPLARPFVNVPISAAAPVPPPGERIPNPDGMRLETVSHPIDARSESLDGAQEIHDDGGDVQVNLSADVLFQLNKADLTPRAEALLKTAAQQIDASPGGTVKVEGHADSSGTDAINDPLSQKRADTVKNRLTALVTRTGVAYDAKGYGSSRPLWSNETDEGRRRNRRVTISFPRPQRPGTPQVPAGGTAAPAGQAGPVTAKDGEGKTTMRAEALAVQPIGGDYGVLTYRVTNEGDARAEIPGLSRDDEWMKLRFIGAASASLVDPAARMRYPAARFLLGTGFRSALCLCTGTAGIRLGADILAPHTAREFWSVVKLPPGATSTSVDLGAFPRIAGVPIR
ncbi:OmpA family protein [Actinomadura roseirufa]|uniref:OmpA family protein n=1 Tax=Actinomadura roseirufa TaxID=2094049 RepID=UPI0010417FDA|nr:OmpA family protein [Actinomadura roseirufa]